MAIAMPSRQPWPFRSPLATAALAVYA